MLGLSIVKVLITQCKMQYKVQYKFSNVIQASIYGCRPDERNLRSGIFKTELCIPCYYRERADHFKKIIRSLAQKLAKLWRFACCISWSCEKSL